MNYTLYVSGTRKTVCSVLALFIVHSIRVYYVYCTILCTRTKHMGFFILRFTVQYYHDLSSMMHYRLASILRVNASKFY